MSYFCGRSGQTDYSVLSSFENHMGGQACGLFGWWCMVGSNAPINHISVCDSFCTCNYFSRRFHIYSLEPVHWQETILFWIVRQKTFDSQIYSEGGPAFLFWIHQNPFHSIDYEPVPNSYLYGGHHTCGHLSGYLSWYSLRGRKLDYVLILFNVLGMQFVLDMVC